MAFSALIFPMLVMMLTTGVFATAWRSNSPLLAFKRSFSLSFALVLVTPWVGAFSAETAIVNGAVAGLLAAALWWVIQRQRRLRTVQETPSPTH